jgi:hypothetical protein
MRYVLLFSPSEPSVTHFKELARRSTQEAVHSSQDNYSGTILSVYHREEVQPEDGVENAETAEH